MFRVSCSTKLAGDSKTGVNVINCSDIYIVLLLFVSNVSDMGRLCELVPDCAALYENKRINALIHTIYNHVCVFSLNYLVGKTWKLNTVEDQGIWEFVTFAQVWFSGSLNILRICKIEFGWL